ASWHSPREGTHGLYAERRGPDQRALRQSAASQAGRRLTMGPLDAYLPYLLNRAGSRIASAFGEEMRPLGASLQIWRVLAALREHDGRRMGDLSRTTSIEVSTLTRLVDNMEKSGLVERRRDAEDARAVALHVTAAGRRLTKRILPIAERY